MATYKSIVTLTWKFDSDLSEIACLQKIKNEIEKIVNTNPHGDEYEDFSIMVDVAKMKDRKKLMHLAKFCPEDIFPYVSKEDCKKPFQVDDKIYEVRLDSDRYHVFKDNPNCVSCGIQGKYMMLDINPGDSSPHFNFYAEENGRLVLMTKDHILAKSKGGEDSLENFQTMCSICNNLKGNYDLDLNKCKKLRELLNNEEKLSKKELRNLINNTRERMVYGKQKRKK